MCRLSWNLGSWTSWNPQGLSRPVMELLYLYLYLSQREFCNSIPIPVHSVSHLLSTSNRQFLLGNTHRSLMFRCTQSCRMWRHKCDVCSRPANTSAVQKKYAVKHNTLVLYSRVLHVAVRQGHRHQDKYTGNRRTAVSEMLLTYDSFVYNLWLLTYIYYFNK